MARGRFYETFEIPAGRSGVSTVLHVHHDSERKEAWQALLERARRPGLRGRVRDASVNIPERITAEQLRDQYGSRAPVQRASFRGSDGKWRENWIRDEHSAALRSFADALRRHYRDQGVEETEGDAPLQAFLDWIRAHLDPSDWGKPKADPNRINTEHVYQYLWPAARPQPLAFKTSSGQGNSSQTMTSGFGGFKTGDSQPARLQQLNAAHRRYYRGKIL